MAVLFINEIHSKPADFLKQFGSFFAKLKPGGKPGGGLKKTTNSTEATSNSTTPLSAGSLPSFQGFQGLAALTQPLLSPISALFNNTMTNKTVVKPTPTPSTKVAPSTTAAPNIIENENKTIPSSGGGYTGLAALTEPLMMPINALLPDNSTSIPAPNAQPHAANLTQARVAPSNPAVPEPSLNALVNPILSMIRGINPIAQPFKTTTVPPTVQGG